MLAVHYDKETGEILQWGDSEPSHGDQPVSSNAKILWLKDTKFNDINSRIHKIDLEYLTIIDKNADQKFAELVPYVQIAIQRELNQTDAFMMPDRPLSEGNRNAWIVYRKALRDLSKQHTCAGAMIRNWPLRPDGAVTHAGLRERLEMIEAGGNSP